ncbi:hypothetical protein FB45DRAFT_889187 [Roridomyces roridus]|uniref:Uncharacterized protein n=1 Tax=Roridomyces roridus TaxID=1738132 RepID=A0AAD7CK92_9AGAR|nr:hypothetical protein FB45DRAFT_889187 [Roridomyces roridus]
MKPDSTTIMELTPFCVGMQEHPSAPAERAKLTSLDGSAPLDPLSLHLSLRLAYTTGSAIGSLPPSTESCLAAFVVPNNVGLTAGARAWSKHAHRSQPQDTPTSEELEVKKKKAAEASAGWWGRASGPVAKINEGALELFWKVINSATWRNLHWLPHQVLVYEVRVADGYGMRWSQDRSKVDEDGAEGPEWIFRGFVEPMMEGGHEVGWRH